MKLTRPKQILYFGEPLLGKDDGLLRGGDLNAAFALDKVQTNLHHAYPNSSLAAASHIHYVGAVGQDESGAKILSELQKNNTNVTTHISAVKDAPTALLIPYQAEDGRTKYRSSTSRNQSASRHFYSDSDAIKETVKKAELRPDVIGFSMITLSRPFEEKSHEFLNNIKALKQQNPRATIVFDSNFRPETWLSETKGDDNSPRRRADAEDIFKQAVSISDTLFITDEDLTHLYSLENEAAETVLNALQNHIGAHSLKDKEIILKRGKEPVFYWPKGTDKTLESKIEIEIPTLTKEQIIDTEGAGDNFSGGTLAAHSAGIPMEQAIKIGALTARQVLQQKGGMLQETSTPTVEQIKETLPESTLNIALGQTKQRG